MPGGAEDLQGSPGWGNEALNKTGASPGLRLRTRSDLSQRERPPDYRDRIDSIGLIPLSNDRQPPHERQAALVLNRL